MFRLLSTFNACLLIGLTMGCSKPVPHQQRVLMPLKSQEDELMNMKADQHWQEGADVFFILKTQTVLPLQKTLPEGFYVRGKIERGKFKPRSGVLGIGDLANEGRYGWLELNSKNFYPMESDRKADVPFVKGYLNNNEFTPSEREVIDGP